MLGEVGLRRMLQGMANVHPSQITGALLTELSRRYPGKLDDDDVTMLLMHANGNEPQVSLTEKLHAAGRFARALVGAIDPRAERPPLPDAHLAKLGGALIPALNQRWRVK